MNEFWAALIGAIVGGGISSGTTWLATRAHWRRDRRERQLERLHTASLDLRRACATVERAFNANRWPTAEEFDELREHFLLVRVLASPVHPKLGSDVRDFASRLDTIKVWRDSDSDGFAKAAEVVRDLSTTVTVWLIAPDGWRGPGTA